MKKPLRPAFAYSCEFVFFPNMHAAVVHGLGFVLALVMVLILTGGTARADCTLVNNVYTCTDTTSNQTIGSGASTSGTSANHITVNVENSGSISAGDRPTISMGDYIDIYVKNGGRVENNAVHNNGNYNSGANTIEVRNNSTITVQTGGSVASLGSQGQAEAINVQGYGNRVLVQAGASVISSSNNATIWFQDTYTNPSQRNVVDNYGTIQHTATGTGAVIGSSGGNGAAGIDFYNRTGGYIQGSLNFGAGDDHLIFEGGSLVSGTINGGGGNNTLTLQGATVDQLTKDISNFQTMTKTGAGVWIISGRLNNFERVLVEKGTLNLIGDNTNFTGTLTINSQGGAGDSSATLLARAQSLPSGASGGITNNGILMINQVSGDDGTYGGDISGSGVLRKIGGGTLTLTGNNSYQGGTWVEEGTLAITSDSALGQVNPFAGVSLGAAATSGTLALLNSIDISNMRTIFLEPGNGIIYAADGTTSSVNNEIFGAGSLTKTGGGTLVLDHGSNTYSGGTNLQEGTLVIGQDSALGNGGALTMGGATTNGTLKLDGGSDVILNPNRGQVWLNQGGGTFDTNGQNLTIGNVIGGSGSLTKTGEGVLKLTTLGNSYTGGTNIAQGTVEITGEGSLGSSASNLSFGSDNTMGTLKLVGTAGANLGSQRQITLNQGGGAIDTNGLPMSIGSQISGSGGLSKDGQGTLTLTGANSYSGGTTINAGELQLGDGGESGSVVGTIVNQATLIANRSNTLNLSGVISGAGNFIQRGRGVTELYGQNDYKGYTSVENGTVAINSLTSTGTGNDIYLGTFNVGATQGTLRADADIDYAAAGVSHIPTIYLNTGGGAVDVSGSNTLILADKQLKNGAASSLPALGGGQGDLHKTGSGVLTLINDQLYNGHTFIDQGTLRLDAVDPAAPMANTKGLLNTPSVNVAQGARLEGQGLIGKSDGSSIITNSGVIAPGLPDFHNRFNNTKPDFINLTLKGTYKATAGAVVEVDVQLYDDSSGHGTLIIDGNVDPGSAVTGVQVINRNGLGALTDKGIEIISFKNGDPGSQAASKFTLLSDFTAQNGKAAIVAGAWAYWLEEDDAIGNGDSLYLRDAVNSTGARLVIPSIPVYELYPQLLKFLNRMPTLQQRVGNRSWPAAAPSAGDSERTAERWGLWTRAEGSTGKYRSKLGSGGQGDIDLDFGKINFDLDLPLFESEAGSKLIGGLNLAFGRAKADIDSDNGNGKIDATSRSLGGGLTWYGHSGFYLDGQYRYIWFDSDLKSRSLAIRTLKNGNDAHGYALSLEGGYVIGLNDFWSLTPQAQLTWGRTSFDDFTDSLGTNVKHHDDAKSLEGRLGLALNYENIYTNAGGGLNRTHFYGLANVYHEFKGESMVNIHNTLTHKSELEESIWLGLAIGGSHNWADNRFSVYGEIGLRGATSNLADNHEWTGELGLRFGF